MDRGGHYDAAVRSLAVAGAHFAAAAGFLELPAGGPRRPRAALEERDDVELGGPRFDLPAGGGGGVQDDEDGGGGGVQDDEDGGGEQNDVVAADGDADEEDFVILTKGHGFGLLTLPLVAAPPYPIYKALPKQILRSAAWTGSLFAYGIVFTAVTTAVSCFVFRSRRCCKCTVLRTVLLIIALVADMVAAFRLVPDRGSMWTSIGTWVTFGHLLAIYLGAWCYKGRDRA